MKRILKTLCLALAVLITPVIAMAQANPTAVEFKTWSQIKTLNLDKGSFDGREIGTTVSPRVSSSCFIRGFTSRPYTVDEHWVDPNNPSSGQHVVMYFLIPDSVNPLNCTIRLWKGYERDWLNRWQMWVRPYGGGQQIVMLFADGSWWWFHRIWQSGATLASQFELKW